MLNLIRFAQTHESFRRPEIEAISQLTGLPIEILSYSENTPFCVLRFSTSSPSTTDQEHLDPTTPSFEAQLQAFAKRSILSKAIHEIWGQGHDYESLHTDLRQKSQLLWDVYRNVSFKFSVDCFGSTRDVLKQREIIDSFRYMDLRGDHPDRLKSHR
jgi:tRNA (guanine10-N2)-methyltransferase